MNKTAKPILLCIIGVTILSVGSVYAVSASSSGGSSTTSSSTSSTSSTSGPDPCTDCGTTDCGCDSSNQSYCTFTSASDCGFGCVVNSVSTNTYGPCCPRSLGCWTSGTGGCDCGAGTYPCDTSCGSEDCSGAITYTTTSGTCDCSTYPQCSGGGGCLICDPLSSCYDPFDPLCGGSSSSSGGSTGGFNCGAAVAGVTCSPDVLSFGSAGTVTITVVDTGWNLPPPNGPVGQGVFSGGVWNGAVLEGISGHSEPTEPTFVMAKIDYINTPGYPYPLNQAGSCSATDASCTTNSPAPCCSDYVEYDFNNNLGVPYGMNPVKNFAGINQNVDAAGHYSYSLTFNLAGPTRFSFKGFPVLSGGPLQSLTATLTGFVPGPAVTGQLQTATTSNVPQNMFNAGDQVRLNWQVVYH